MGYTVYAHCYVRRGSERSREFLAAIESLSDASLFVPHAEPISVKLDGLETLLEPIPRFERVAWCFSKISYALNPRFAEAVFILRMKRLARRFQSDCHIYLKDDGSEFGEISGLSDAKIASLFMLAILESPIWLLIWIRGLL
jgi:hypothetical protein